ncbi:MAG TPA: alpha/beta fold hydrolase [Nocardioidaceae bacterium]|nr:alpha/beta fold hydrolase [Nocardioidaceae bacterium]
MDLIPKPDQVVSAASNVAHKMLYGGVADLRPMPRTLIDDGMLREVYHYRPQGRVKESGDPVLLVTPLAAPAICFDLRRGCSLVEHLVTSGRRTYLVEYGEISFANRTLGLEHWVDEVIPAAIREVSEHAGGRPVHVVGWSLGGIFSLLVAADRTDLPIASLTVLGSPVDVTKVPLIAPIRPLLHLTGPEGGGLVTQLYRVMGGAPKPLVRRAFQLSSFNKLVTKPLAMAVNLDDTDFLAQVEAVDRFTQNMTGYPGRSFGQIYHRMIKGNQLATGVVRMDDKREIALENIKVPMLVFAGANDGIAPVQSIRPMVDLVPNARSVRFEVVPGGHLGMLTGRAARSTTWRIIDEFLDEHGAAIDVHEAKPASKRARKTPAKKAAAKKVAAKKTSARPDAIGSNPARTYGSASSRSLAARK